MKYEIRLIIDKNIWERLNLNSQYPSIFQSWNYGQAEISIGNHIDRLGFYKEQELVGIAQLLLVKARRGKFLHVRGGPVFIDYHKDFPIFLPHLLNYAQKKEVSFLRISPCVLKSDNQFEKILTKNKFLKSPIPFLDAEVSWVLNIQKTEDEILKDMRKTTRYLIRKSQRNGVIIKKTVKKEAIFDFLKIYQIMAHEKGMVPHKGITEEYAEFKKDDQVVLLLGYFQKKLLGGCLILFYGDSAIYHHSAHLRISKDISVSYLLQWEAILESRRRGKKYYNFWGIEPSGNPHHPWYGLSSFKKGFGGEVRQFVGSYDYPQTFYYYITRVIEIARRIKRYKSY